MKEMEDLNDGNGSGSGWGDGWSSDDEGEA